jgi:hypothetical protein
VVMQVYALHMSTFHIFNNMPPMCELCAIAKNSGNGLISAAAPVSHSFKHFHDYEYVSNQFDYVVEFRYQPRAPPYQLLA